jgi:hypothetical protein
MTRYLSFVSNGEIELAALSLIGASDKRDAEDKLGFFGSGAKHALAVLLREGLDIQLWSGVHPIGITTERVDFRGKSFEAIVVEGHRTSMTTEMGPQWTVQDAVREVYTNAFDEGLRIFYRTSNPGERAEPGCTVFAIEINDDIALMLAGWDSYFKSPGNMEFTIIPTRETAGRATGFRRGIRVCDLPGALFSYNLPDVKIDEQRKASQFDFGLIALRKLVQHGEPKHFHTLLTHQDAMEWKYWFFTDLSPDHNLGKFLLDNYDFVTTEKKSDRVPHDKRALIVKDPSNEYKFARVLPTLDKWLKEHRSSVCPLPDDMVPLIESGRAFLRRLGFEAEFPILFDPDSIIENVLAYAEDGQVILTSLVFTIPIRELNKTLIEEAIHIEHGHNDFSREFQEASLELIMRATELN